MGASIQTITVLTILVSLLHFPRTVLAAPDLSARDLLEKCADAARWANHAHVKIEIESSVTIDGQSRPPRKFSVERFSDGDRLRILYHNFEPNGEVGSRFDLLVTPRVRIFWKPNGPLEDQSVDFSAAPDNIPGAAEFDRAAATFGWFLDGAIGVAPYRRFAPEIAAQKGKIQDTVEDERVDGLDCKQITVSNDAWVYRLWVAPSRSFNFARITFDHQPMPSRADQYHITVGDVQYEQLPSGKWLIVGGTYALHTLQNIRGVYEYHVAARRTEFDLAPDFEMLRAFDAPAILNGTSVGWYRFDENGIHGINTVPLFWQDGYVMIDVVTELTNLVNKPIFGFDDSFDLFSSTILPASATYSILSLL
jgi:hypothetical protein